MIHDDPDVIQLMGRTSASAALLNFCSCNPSCGHADRYARGMLEGVRDSIAAKDGAPQAYAVVQNVADRVAAPILAASPKLEPVKRHRPSGRDWAVRLITGLGLILSGASPC